MAKLNTAIQLISGFRVLLGGVLLFIAIVGTLFVTLTVHSDDLKVPPPPTGPVGDTQSVLASNTVTAKAEQDEQRYVEGVRNGAYGTPLPKNVIPPVPSPIATVEVDSSPPPLSGIDLGQSEKAGWSSKYHIRNGWYGHVGTNLVMIYAGSKADTVQPAIWNDPEQGVIIVSGSAMSGDTEYFTPTRSGPVAVTSYLGTCVTLTSSMGTQYTFDAQNDSWSCNGSKP